jgi:nucleoside-diphosphate-sugar epimerase
MACLVTGGTGLIGAHGVRRFLESGETVIAYDIAPDIARLERTIGKDATRAVAVIQSDEPEGVGSGLAGATEKARKPETDQPLYQLDKEKDTSSD